MGNFAEIKEYNVPGYGSVLTDNLKFIEVLAEKPDDSGWLKDKSGKVCGYWEYTIIRKDK